MRWVAVGRYLRVARIRRGWRQVDVAARARMSASVVARQERGMVTSLAMLERHAVILDLRLDLRLIGRSGQAPMVTDEEHAAIIAMLAGWFGDRGYVVEPEASFSEYGERGRIDLLAYDPTSETLAIVEVKTLLVDIQDLLGAINVRRRLASTIAARRGWRARRVVTMLAVARTPLNRSAVALHAPLFDSFAVRRLAATVLLHETQVLVWIEPRRVGRERWIGGKQRVRLAGRDRREPL